MRVVIAWSPSMDVQLPILLVLALWWMESAGGVVCLAMYLEGIFASSRNLHRHWKLQLCFVVKQCCVLYIAHVQSNIIAQSGSY